MTSEFVAFLLEAKRRTYAAQGDDASVQPALPGSKQLEHRRGEYVYRDIYFGMRQFVGQETVYHLERPVWSMGYGGGICRSDAEIDEVRSVYAFLRKAMRQVSPEQPFRGPPTYDWSPYRYTCNFTGDMDTFWGVEEISDRSGVVYRLHFAGGRVDE